MLGGTEADITSAGLDITISTFWSKHAAATSHRGMSSIIVCHGLPAALIREVRTFGVPGRTATGTLLPFVACTDIAVSGLRVGASTTTSAMHRAVIAWRHTLMSAGTDVAIAAEKCVSRTDESCSVLGEMLGSCAK